MKFSVLALLSVVLVLQASDLSIMESSTEGVVFHMTAAQPRFTNTSLRGDRFSSVHVAGADNLSEFSMPRVPVLRAWIEIPAGAEVVPEISEKAITEIDGPMWPIEPGIMSASKNEPRDAFTMELDPEVYQNGKVFPDSRVRIIYAGTMRGRNLALVEVFPMRWDPSKNKCTFMSEATISLTFRGGDLAKTYEDVRHYYAPHFERMLSAMTANYGTFENGVDTPPSPYLIVGHKDFVSSALNDFVSWKEDQGFKMTMVDLDSTGSTVSDIQSYIRNAIENWDDPPEFVLLVGDVDYLPGNTATKYDGVTDLYYVTVGSDDYFPDAYIGRFSVTSAEQAQRMADRVVNYERDVTGSTSWVQHTCWIASEDNNNITEGTHNYCITEYVDPKGYKYVKVYPKSGGKPSDVITSVNNGVSMLTFSGHGSQTYWQDMQFKSSDFNQLKNVGKFPGVLSHACLTGDFATSTAWCETWTRTEGKGGLWFWGSVPSSYWDEDDIQQKAEYEYFLDKSINWPMGFLNPGKRAVYDHYSGGGRSKYYYEGYNLMGDPSVAMAIWGSTAIDRETRTVSPGNITVNNPAMGATLVTLNGDGPAELSVFDITGRLVEVPFRGDLRGKRIMTWDTSDLVPGMYFLRLENGGEAYTTKVMVIN